MSTDRERSGKTKILVECALLTAAACLLSLIKFSPFPFGGSVTVGSMVPIILASWRRGPSWGMLSAFAFGIFRFMIGFDGAGTMSVFTTLMSVFLDYLAAFTVLGAAGIFRGRLRRAHGEIVLGALVACFLRYLCHVVSGFLFFAEWAEWFFGETGAFGQAVLERFGGASLSVVYSLIYNATYMLPETVITLILCGLLSMIPAVSETGRSAA